MKISDIIHYPVKSLRANHLKSSEVHERALKDDRRFMLIDKNNTFVSQRKFPMLSQIDVGISENHLVLKNRRNNQVIQHALEFELKKTEMQIALAKQENTNYNNDDTLKNLLILNESMKLLNPARNNFSCQARPFGIYTNIYCN